MQPYGYGLSVKLKPLRSSPMETYGSLEVEVRPTQRTRGGTKRAYRGRVATARKKPVPIIYIILCTVNQRRYYGEGIGKNRRSNHRAALREGTVENPDLRVDWDLYGETRLRWVVLHSGWGFESRATRLRKGTALIASYPDLA